MRHFAAYRSVNGIVFYYMITAVVFTEVILHGSECMVDCYIIIGGVVRFAECPEQKFKIQHIIDDNGELPFVCMVVPGTDTADYRFVTGNQGACGLQQNIFIGGISGQTITVSIAALHLEAHVVCLSVIFFAFLNFCMFLRLLFPIWIVRVLI